MLRSMFGNDSEIDCYQDLIIAEYENLEDNAFAFEEKNSRLNSSQIQTVCTRHGLDEKEVKKPGLLVEYPDGTFRTVHMDLVYRAINARAASWSPKIPLEFKLVKPRIELMPSFNEHKLEELEPLLHGSKKTDGMLVAALGKSGYTGLAHHQLHYLTKILSNNDKCFLLVSPTASGKSLIFYIAILASILSNPEVKGTSAFVLYPRKALASDQLVKFLRVVNALNQLLSTAGMSPLSVGIDDGDTPRSSSSVEVRKGEVFRGVKCIRNNCGGALRYRLAKSVCRVVCEKCNSVHEEIVATKGDIWASQPNIVFSNLSSLNRRLMTKSAQSILGPQVKWIVLDEAHVYREEMGGHSRWLLRRILARFSVLVKGDANVIISSATIHNPLGFSEKLLGLSDRVYYEEYQKILETSKNKKRKLLVNLIIAPNPLRTAESLAEEVSLELGVWGYAHGKKSIVFIDNVSEVERLRDFVVNTIILERKAQDDHINPNRTPSVSDVSQSFSWLGISNGLKTIDASKLAAIYDHHYAELNSEDRARVEESFKNHPSGILFATSTMELGMDVGNVAAVIQYKIPLTAESYVQRIGRAGRSDEVGRIALGILVLTNSPSQIRYVLEDEYKRLLEPQVEIPVAWENEEIRKQHVIYSVLDYQASKNKSTFMDFTTEIKSTWFSVSDALNSLKTLITDTRRELVGLESYEREIAGDNSSVKTLSDVLDQMESKVDFGLKNFNASSGADIDDGLKMLRQAENKVLDAKRTIGETTKLAQAMKNEVNAKELNDYESSVKALEESLTKVLGAMEKLWS
jgi:DEAD/DEAH box helicase domain-containing protein